MPATRFRSDPKLTRRMLSVFALVIVFHAALFGYFALTSNVVAAGVIIGGGLIAQWWYGDRLALRSLGARPVTADEEPRLHGHLDRLCTLADMPKPAVAIAEQSLPNAFAVGRTPRHSTLCVTRRLLDELDGDELEAVLAHELAHIAHRDVIVMTGASSICLLVESVGRLVTGQETSGSRQASAGRQRRRFDPWIVLLWGYVVMYYVSGMLGSALSRYRELSADRSAAYLTGNPSALASAVTRLSGVRIAECDLRDVGAAGDMLFVAVPRTGRIRSKFVTYPPVTERLGALAQVASDLQRPTT